ncbi:MAG: toll/interleukin-1 receptor domain-containing protein [Pseudomonadota bacterium]
MLKNKSYSFSRSIFGIWLLPNENALHLFLSAYLEVLAVFRPGTGIFLSYRRADTGAYAGRIRDRLAAQFGDDHVFLDISSIPTGKNFRTEMFSALTQSQIMLVLIGPNWVNSRNATNERRLFQEGDHVRMEVAAGLQNNINVIPVCIEGAPMPEASEVPDDISELCNRNRVTIRNESFERDISELISSLKMRSRSLGRLAKSFAIACIAASVVLTFVYPNLLSTTVSLLSSYLKGPPATSRLQPATSAGDTNITGDCNITGSNVNGNVNVNCSRQP